MFKIEALVWIPLAWILADFVGGLIHWAMDHHMVGPFRVRFLDGIRLDNDRHHEKPGAMLQISLWGNIGTTLAVTVPMTILLMAIEAPAVITLAVFFLSFVNVVHRWAHTPRGKLPRVIRWGQAIGALSSLKAHARHHQGARDKRDSREGYCPLTDWLNPILDRVHFFDALDGVFVKLRR